MIEMCAYCSECEDGDMISGKTYSVFGARVYTSSDMEREEKRIRFYIDDELAVSIDINYCPMCGRKLRDSENEGN